MPASKCVSMHLARGLGTLPSSVRQRQSTFNASPCSQYSNSNMLDLVNADHVRMPHIIQRGHLLAKHKGMKTQHVSTASKNATHDHIGFPNKY